MANLGKNFKFRLGDIVSTLRKGPKPSVKNPVILDLQSGPMAWQSGKKSFLVDQVKGRPGAKGIAIEPGDYKLGYGATAKSLPQSVGDRDMGRLVEQNLPAFPQRKASEKLILLSKEEIKANPKEWAKELRQREAEENWSKQGNRYPKNPDADVHVLQEEAGPGLTPRPQEFFPAVSKNRNVIPEDLDDVKGLRPTTHPELHGKVHEAYWRRPFGLGKADAGTRKELGMEIDRIVKPGGFIEFRILDPQKNGEDVACVADIARHMPGARVVEVPKAALDAYHPKKPRPPNLTDEQWAILKAAGPDLLQQHEALGRGRFDRIIRIQKADEYVPKGDLKCLDLLRSPQGRADLKELLRQSSGAWEAAKQAEPREFSGSGSQGWSSAAHTLEHLRNLREDAATARIMQDAQRMIETVNPSKGKANCHNCVIAAYERLYGRKGIVVTDDQPDTRGVNNRFLEDHFTRLRMVDAMARGESGLDHQCYFRKANSLQDVVDALRDAGHGSSGVLKVQNGPNKGHVVFVANVDGRIVLMDGQKPEARLSSDAAVQNWTRRWPEIQFMPTPAPHGAEPVLGFGPPSPAREKALHVPAVSGHHEPNVTPPGGGIGGAESWAGDFASRTGLEQAARDQRLAAIEAEKHRTEAKAAEKFQADLREGARLEAPPSGPPRAHFPSAPAEPQHHGPLYAPLNAFNHLVESIPGAQEALQQGAAITKQMAEETKRDWDLTRSPDQGIKIMANVISSEGIPLPHAGGAVGTLEKGLANAAHKAGETEQHAVQAAKAAASVHPPAGHGSYGSGIIPDHVKESLALAQQAELQAFQWDKVKDATQLVDKINAVGGDANCQLDVLANYRAYYGQGTPRVTADFYHPDKPTLVWDPNQGKLEDVLNWDHKVAPIPPLHQLAETVNGPGAEFKPVADMQAVRKLLSAEEGRGPGHCAMVGYTDHEGNQHLVFAANVDHDIIVMDPLNRGAMHADFHPQYKDYVVLTPPPLGEPALGKMGLHNPPPELQMPAGEAALTAAHAAPAPPQATHPAVFPRGSLSQKYESGGDPGRVSSGFLNKAHTREDLGGVSYGAYQFTSRYIDKHGEKHDGTVQSFLRSSSGKRWAPEFRDAEGRPLKAATPEFSAKWQEIARREPGEFKAAQHAYIDKNFYHVQAAHVAKTTGVDVEHRSRTVQNAVWSTAVQHGAGSDVVRDALRGEAVRQHVKPSQLSDEDCLRAIYRERTRVFPDTQTRYAHEYVAAVGMLQAERMHAQPPASVFEAGRREALGGLGQEIDDLRHRQNFDPRAGKIAVDVQGQERVAALIQDARQHGYLDLSTPPNGAVLYDPAVSKADGIGNQVRATQYCFENSHSRTPELTPGGSWLAYQDLSHNVLSGKRAEEIRHSLSQDFTRQASGDVRTFTRMDAAEHSRWKAEEQALRANPRVTCLEGHRWNQGQSTTNVEQLRGAAAADRAPAGAGPGWSGLPTSGPPQDAGQRPPQQAAPTPQLPQQPASAPPKRAPYIDPPDPSKKDQFTAFLVSQGVDPHAYDHKLAARNLAAGRDPLAGQKRETPGYFTGPDAGRKAFEDYARRHDAAQYLARERQKEAEREERLPKIEADRQAFERKMEEKWNQGLREAGIDPHAPGAGGGGSGPKGGGSNGGGPSGSGPDGDGKEKEAKSKAEPGQKEQEAQEREKDLKVTKQASEKSETPLEKQPRESKETDGKEAKLSQPESQDKSATAQQRDQEQAQFQQKQQQKAEPEKQEQDKHQQARAEQQKQEQEKQQQAKAEQQKQEQEKQQQAKVEQQKQEQEKQQQAKVEQQKQEQEKQQQAKAEQQKQEQEKQQQAKAEQQKQEQEKQQQAKAEQQKQDQEKQQQAKPEQQKQEQEKQKQAKTEQQKQEQEKQKQAKTEQQRQEQEKEKQAKAEQQKQEQEKQQQAKAEQQKQEQEKQPQAKAEQQKQEQDKEQQAKAEQQKPEQEKQEQAKAEQQRQDQEKQQQAKAEQQKQEQEKHAKPEQQRQEQEKEKQAKPEQQRQEQEKEKQAKPEQQRQEQEKEKQAKPEQQRQEPEKQQQAKAEQQRPEQEKQQQAKAEQQKQEQEKQQQAKAEQQKQEQEKQQKQEQEKQPQAKAEQQKQEQDKEQQAKAEQQKPEQAKQEQAKAEQQRQDQEKQQQAKAEQQKQEQEKQAKPEQQRQEQEKQQQAKAEQQKQEQEKQQQAKAEQQKQEQEKQQQAKAEQQKQEQEKQPQAKAEQQKQEQDGKPAESRGQDKSAGHKDKPPEQSRGDAQEAKSGDPQGKDKSAGDKDKPQEQNKADAQEAKSGDPQGKDKSAGDKDKPQEQNKADAQEPKSGDPQGKDKSAGDKDKPQEQNKADAQEAKSGDPQGKDKTTGDKDKSPEQNKADPQEAKSGDPQGKDKTTGDKDKSPEQNKADAQEAKSGDPQGKDKTTGDKDKPQEQNKADAQEAKSGDARTQDKSAGDKAYTQGPKESVTKGSKSGDSQAPKEQTGSAAKESQASPGESTTSKSSGPRMRGFGAKDEDQQPAETGSKESQAQAGPKEATPSNGKGVRMRGFDRKPEDPPAQTAGQNAGEKAAPQPHTSQSPQQPGVQPTTSGSNAPQQAGTATPQQQTVQPPQQPGDQPTANGSNTPQQAGTATPQQQTVQPPQQPGVQPNANGPSAPQQAGTATPQQQTVQPPQQPGVQPNANGPSAPQQAGAATPQQQTSQPPQQPGVQPSTNGPSAPQQAGAATPQQQTSQPPQQPGVQPNANGAGQKTNAPDPPQPGAERSSAYQSSSPGGPPNTRNASTPDVASTRPTASAATPAADGGGPTRTSASKTNDGAPPDRTTASKGNDGAPPDRTTAAKTNDAAAPPDRTSAAKGSDGGPPTRSPNPPAGGSPTPQQPSAPTAPSQSK